MDQSILPPRPTLDQLRHVALNFPIIDNHAHSLILPTHAETIPFESITTEAQGRALRDTFKSLSHLRAAKQLRQLYECGEDADWEDILDQRDEWLRSNSQRLHERCFEGVHAILVDDGLADSKSVYPYDSHDEYLDAPSKRLVRIESVAEKLMERIVGGAKDDDLGKPKFLPDTWLEFTDEFEREIQDAIKDPEVAGFKTVICYRTGLDIEPDYEEAAKSVGHPFERYVKACVRKRNYRIERKPLNDYLVLRTLEILSDDLPRSDSLSKPLQFHTGLGDNDIKLRESNPSYLQQVIESYPGVPFVLLHASYPYTQEAAYLATVYRHVYLDIGEVFPMVSRDGQLMVLRQALELVPGSRHLLIVPLLSELLYSSAGHWFPETFWLANRQFREVWLELLIEYVQKRDVTIYQAIAMTKDILFNNSNILYALHYEAVFDETIQVVPKQIAFNSKAEVVSPISSPPILPPAGATMRPATFGPVDPRSGSPYEQQSFPPPPKVPHVFDIQLFDDFMTKNPKVRFVYVHWLDSMVTTRVRIVPIKEFTRMIHEGDRIGISQGNTGTLQDDTSTPGINTTEQTYIEPDLRSLRRTHSKDPLPSATVLSYLRSESGSPLSSCPRNNLEILVNDLQYNHSTTLLISFKMQVTFLSRNSNSQGEAYSPLSKTRAWSTTTPEQWLQLPFLTESVLALDEMSIEMQQFSAESGHGQYEFILPPQPPVPAIDTLIQARQVISQIAALHGLRATLYPKPFDGLSTATHVHMSLNPPVRDMQFFVGGVVAHLPAISAFSMPESASYAPEAGMWVAWGTQTRDVPLRRAKEGIWEVRCLDGMANMYLALTAIVAAGLLGLQSAGVEAMHYSQLDVPVDPNRMDEAGRARFGVMRRMPATLEEALLALMKDSALVEALRHGAVRDYVGMKETEQRMLAGMGEVERRMFLIERY